MRFCSDAKQDEFVANILNFKKDGYCVDIGSCHSILSNNTFAFQELDWTSLSVEIESSYNDSYPSTRKLGIHLNENALKVDYKKELEECPFEDWWINPEEFDTELIEKIKCDSLLPSQIIERFKS